MNRLLQDPSLRVLGQKQFETTCCFGKSAEKITAWMQNMAWHEHIAFQSMLYELHVAFHAKAHLTQAQDQFLRTTCVRIPELQPLRKAFETNLM